MTDSERLDLIAQLLEQLLVELRAGRVQKPRIRCNDDRAGQALGLPLRSLPEKKIALSIIR